MKEYNEAIDAALERMDNGIQYLEKKLKSYENTPVVWYASNKRKQLMVTEKKTEIAIAKRLRENIKSLRK